MNVLIVGAGPAGATLALLLARAGVGVTLVERERDFARVFRGEGLMPFGIDAIRAMGLGALLDSLPQRELESWDMYVGGRPSLSVPEPREALGDRAVRVVPQPAFLEGVIARAAEQPGFRFERGVTVRDLLREGERVIGVRVEGDAGARTLYADLVIGCDGRASVVRKRAGLELDLLPESYDVLWFKLPAPERLREGSRFLMMASSTHLAAAYTSWDGRLQYALTLPKGGFRQRRGADWVEEMAAPCPPWLAEHVRASRGEVEGPVVLDVVVGRARSWHAPGLLLIGDAAHPMSPIRAQGINVALRDAIVAANHLVAAAAAAAPREALADAVQAVQREREPEIERAQALQHRDARGWFTWYAPILIAIAGRLGPLVGRFAWAQRAWLDQQHDLRFGSTEVALRVPPGGPGGGGAPAAPAS